MSPFTDQRPEYTKAWFWIFVGVVLFAVSGLSALMTWITTGVFVPGGGLLAEVGYPLSVLTLALGLLSFAKARRMRGET
jgi:hypothetical protein